LAQELGATEILVAAALANNRGYASAVGVVDADRVAVLESACQALEGTESAERARLLALLALELTFGGDFPLRKALADQALSIARSLNDPETLARVIASLYSAIGVPETLTERLSLAEEALRAARSVGDPVLQRLCADYLLTALFQAGDIAGADQVLSDERSMFGRLPLAHLWLASQREAARAILVGDLEEAERLVLETYETSTASGQPDAGTLFAGQTFSIRLRQGRSDEILDLAIQLFHDNPGMPSIALMLSMAQCDCDNPEEACAVLQPFVATGFTSVPKDPLWLFSLSGAAYAAAELGWREASEILFVQLQPFAAQIPETGGFDMAGVS
jgi:hypothetical protein